MTNSSTTESRAPGGGTLVVMIGVLTAGGTALIVGMPSGESWQAGALAGFVLSGLMGIFGLWTVRRACRSGNQAAFVRTVFGAMLVRLVLGGVAAGLVVGLRWFDATGFVIGLFAGVVLFQGIEIGGVLIAAKRIQGPVEGATGHAR